MSRAAQDVLEFDKLRELLRLRTTCAPGRRVIDALEVSTNRGALEGEFALIREAREWLRLGRELGFGAVPGRRRQVSIAGGALRVAGRFSGFASGNTAMRAAEWRDQRRRV